MTLPLRVRPEAESDIEEAAAWYEQQRLGLGNEFLDEILRIYATISEQPTLYPTLHRRTQRALTRRFPFGVYYRVEEECTVVVAVVHGSRNPDHWKKRT